MPQADHAHWRRHPRAALLRWAGWFCLISAALMALIGIRYVAAYGLPPEPLAALYVVTAYLGHFALLGCLPLLLLVPLALILPRPGPVLVAGVLMAAAMLTLVLVDSLVFGENRFHLNGFTIAILGLRTWGFAALYLLIFIVFGALLARHTWPKLAGHGKRRYGLGAGLLVAVIVLVSQGLHVWAEARYYVPITAFTPYLPFYKPATAKGLMSDLGLVDMSASREGSRVRLNAQERGSQRLDYPLTPLQCQAPESAPRNVLLVLVDGMRADSLRPDLAPNMSRFAGNAMRFERHYSGGNSSRSGMFSLFYGLPPVYWQDFNALQRSAVLVDTMQEQDYQFGIYSTSELYRPVNLDRTAFANIPDLRLGTPGEITHQRDRETLSEWRRWLEARDGGSPFFSVLILDSARQHDYPPDASDTPAPAADNESAQRERGEYRRAMRYVDSLVGEALDTLRTDGLMDETVVLMTSDHGQSFDDNAQGYIGYGSSFNEYQLHVPLAVHWPGRDSGRVKRRTSHYDVVPTLMRRVLGCENPPEDYSSGKGLFEGQGWQWLIAGSYHNFAIVQPDRILVTYPGGYHEVRDADYRLTGMDMPPPDVMTAAMREMSRFYR